jgi:hypothetical protein
LVPSFLAVPALKELVMDGVPAVYLGRIVSKENFRVFIFSASGTQRLVESWDDYEQAMASGIWYAIRDEINPVEEQQITRPVRVRKAKATAIDILDADDFLPTASA